MKPLTARLPAIAWTAGICALLAMPPAAHAQTYPAKPIRVIMTLGAGGGGDAAARLIAQKLSESVGQPVLVEAQGGAAGAIGAEMVARAAPDGYTLAFAISSTMILRKFLVKNTTYDAIRDFTPIMQLAETIAVVVAGPSMPANTLAEAIEYARRNPGKVSYGSSGIGTTHHLAGEMIQLITGVKMVHVPYKSGSQGAVDAISGRIQLMFNIMGSMLPHVGPGKLKILAVNNGKRFHRLPDVPTIAEVIPGYDRSPGWIGYMGPAGLPQLIVKRLYDELHKAATLPEVSEKLDALGIPVDTLNPAEFSNHIKRTLEVTAKLMKAARIEPE